MTEADFLMMNEKVMISLFSIYCGCFDDEDCTMANATIALEYTFNTYYYDNS